MKNRNSPKIFHNCFYWLGIIFLFLTVFFTIQAKAWIEPDQVPPDGNISAPLNTGNSGQIKTGGLILNTGGATLGLIVDKGLVGIGTNNPQAILDITSTSSGFLPPRMTTAQRNAIGSPQFGLIIINSDTKKVNIYNGSTWEAIGGDSSAGGNVVYANGDGRDGENFCQKSLITDDGLQGNWENISEGKACGAGKWCKNGSCIESCGLDFYWNGSSCTDVGVGNYSPNDNNSLYNCSNKPANSSYTGSGGGANNCSWSCNANYVQSGVSCVPSLTIRTVNGSCNSTCASFGQSCLGAGTDGNATNKTATKHTYVAAYLEPHPDCLAAWGQYVAYNSCFALDFSVIYFRGKCCTNDDTFNTCGATLRNCIPHDSSCSSASNSGLTCDTAQNSWSCGGNTATWNCRCQ